MTALPGYPRSSRSRNRGRGRRRGGFGWRLVAVPVVLLLAAAGGLLYFLYRDLPTCPTGPGPVGIALGARQNSPTPTLPAEVTDVLHGAADAEKRIVIYRIDGDPSVAIDETFAPQAKAKNPRDLELAAFLTRLTDAVSKVRSLTKEADPLRALWLVARAVPAGGTVVLDDSGLQTLAPLNFVSPGMIEAEPTDVVASLRAVDAIPDLTGRRVILMGLGDTVAPQDNIDQQMHDNVVAIWKAIVTAGGANPGCVRTLPYPPADRTPLAGVQYVTPIPVAKPPPPTLCSESRLYNGGAVGFQPDLAVLRNRSAATDFLRPYAQSIVANDERVELIGTTARWGDADGQKRLGKQRAEAIKQLLVELGVAGERIHTDGVGSYSDYYQNDGGPKGPLKPGAAALNRSVVVHLLCTGSS